MAEVAFAGMTMVAVAQDIETTPKLRLTAPPRNVP